jgi:hypothetical protein
MIYAIFVLLSTGVLVQTDIPPFDTMEACQTRLREMNIKDTSCQPLHVARK